MSSPAPAPVQPTPDGVRLTPLIRTLVLTAAAIGFLFDTYELLMLPLIGGPALSELLGVPPSNPAVREWVGYILWAAAVCGGISGLLGGWLIDRFGRKTVMVASILVYALSPVAAAFSTSVWAFAFFRCTTFIGVCVEFVAAVTWVAELFQEKRAKELALGWTLAFSSVGGLVVTLASRLVGQFAEQLPAVPVPEPLDPHAPWRYTLVTGLIPGLLILLLMPFVPESRVWAERRRAGTLRRPSFGELFAPRFRRVTLVATALSATGYAAAFGALQLTPTQIAPGSPVLHEQREVLAPLQDNPTLAEGGKKFKDKDGKDLPDGAVQLNEQLSDAKGRLEAAYARVPGLREKITERDAVRRDIRKLRDKEATLADAGQDATAVGEEIKKRTAPLLPASDETKAINELLKDDPEAKKARGEYEKALADLGANRAKQRKADKEVREFAEQSQFWQETGGLVGRILLAVLLVVMTNKGWLLRVFLLPGLIAFPLTYLFLFKSQPDWFLYGVFVCGLCTVAQFSYFGEYLPKMYPLHLRGTGGSFATNVGGRMIGTSGSFISTTLLAPNLPGGNTFEKVAVAAGVVGLGVYVIGTVLSFLLPQSANTGEEAESVAPPPQTTAGPEVEG